MEKNYLDTELINYYNSPMIKSPSAEYGISMDQTRESLYDASIYKSFINNAIRRFRNSPFYKGYKNFLIEMGMDHCQVLGNISTDMGKVKVEMHHVLPIDMVAIIICEHILNTVGKINTFQLVRLLKNEHKKHHMQITMLSETAHEVYHDNVGMFLNTNMTFGNFAQFLFDYRYGITEDIAMKLLSYIKKIEKETQTTDNDYLALREHIKEWSEYNEYIAKSSGMA